MSRAARAFVADLARVAPPVKKPNPLSIANTRGLAESGERKRIKARDVALFENMCLPIEKGGQRPLKPLCPSSTSNLPARVSAGALALRRDKVLGVYEEPRR